MRKVRNLIIAILSVICVACMFTACAKPSITLDKATIELGWGAQAQIEATLTDSEDTIKWSSSDETVVTVDQNGLVMAVETGTATVTATAGEGKKQVSASCTVTVGEYQLAVTASEESVALLTYGDSTATAKTVTASVVANGATVSNPTLTWTSSNPAVATVNNGVITAVAKGNATITVTATKDGRTATDTIAVSVNKTVVAAPYTASKEYDVRATSISQALESLGLAGYNGTVSVTSTGATVASAAIDGDNLVINATANAAGTVDYMVEVADRILTLKVTYYELTLALNKEEVALKVSTVNTGDVTSETLTYTASKDGGTIAYASSNDAIATVTNAGVITSVAAGEVTITATYTFDGFTATDSVVVTISKSVIATAYEVSEIVLPVDSKIALIDVGMAESYAGSVALSINGTAVAGATVNAGNVVLPTTGIPAHEQTLVLEFADRVVSVETFIVTHVADSVDTFMAWLNGDRNNTYLRLTGDIALPDDAEKYDTAAPSNFTLDGNGKKISGWIESVGIFRYGGTNITIKNVTLQNVKASSTIFGHGWKGNCLFENVTLVANMTSAANNRLFFYNASGLTATFKNCNITINVDATKVNNPMFLAASGSDIDSTNTYIFDNTTITSKGVIADVTDNYSFINGSYFTDKNIVSEATALTYDAKYVTKADGKFALDLTKLSSAIDLTKVVKMTVGEMAATYVVDGNNITITTENAGYKAVAFESVVNGRLAQTSAKITIATHTAGNIDQFKAWFTGDRNNTCLVLTADITFPGGETYSGAHPTNFTLDGQGYTINGWWESCGFFRNGGRDVTIRNVDFINIKSELEFFGANFKGNCLIENVSITGYFNGSANQEAILFDDCKELVLTVKDCDFYFTIPQAKVDKTYYLVSVWSSSFPHPAETSFPISFINTNVVTNGTIGNHPANFTFTNCNIIDKADIVATTYADAYITNAIDLTKLGQDIVPEDICMVVVGDTAVPFSVDGTNLAITMNSKGAGEITIFTKTGAVKISVTVANIVISDEASFKTWATAGHGTSGDKYAVVTENITLTEDVELNATWFGGWTLDGLGHTVSNIYDWSGMFPGGTGNITLKNITLNMKTCSSAFGDDWYGTNNFTNVKINVSVPGHAGTANLLFDRVRTDTVFNFTDCEFKFNVDSAKQTVDMGLMQTSNSGIKVNLTNSDITSNGYIADSAISACTLDANSSIVGRKKVVEQAITSSVEYFAIVDGKITIDLTKLSETFNKDNIASVTVAGAEVTYEVDGDNLVITTDKYGEVAVAIKVEGATVDNVFTFNTIFATHVLTDNDTFKDFYSKQRNKTYAVVANDIALQETPETGASYFHTGSTVNGLGHTVTDIYNYAGWYASCLGDGVLKNIKVKVKSYSGAISDEIGNFTMENVTMDITVPGGATTNYVFGRKLLSGRKFTIKDCTINVHVDNAKKETAFILANVLEGSMEIINSTIHSNGWLIGLGDVYNSSAWGSGKVTMDATSKITDEYVPVESVSATYDAEYVQLVDGNIVIDLTKVSEEMVAANIDKVSVASQQATFSVDGNNLTIATAKNGNVEIVLIDETEELTTAVAFSVVIANFVLNDEASFKAWATAGHGTSGDRYAVVTENITLTEDVEINSAWFGGWTLDGLGHTVSNIYDYSGMFPGGAGNITIKNITLNMKTCSSAFGSDWYGTNNFINVKINVSVPGHAGTSNLLFDGVRADTVFNFTDCEFKFNMSGDKQDVVMGLMQTKNSGIKVNLVNSSFVSMGTISSDAISACTLDANSSITHKGTVA